MIPTRSRPSSERWTVSRWRRHRRGSWSESSRPRAGSCSRSHGSVPEPPAARWRDGLSTGGPCEEERSGATRARPCARELACCCARRSPRPLGWRVPADAVLSADIPPQPVASALAEFAHQTGLQFIYVSQLAQARASKGARAGLAPDRGAAGAARGHGAGLRVPERAHRPHLRNHPPRRLRRRRAPRRRSRTAAPRTVDRHARRRDLRDGLASTRTN